MYLNGKNVLYPCVTEIVWNHIRDDKEKFNNMTRKFVENKKIFQFAYSYSYHEIYSFVEKRSLDLRNEFHIGFKELKDKKMQGQKNFEQFKTIVASETSPPPPTRAE